MALVVFLRGVNVGGHKTFRPSVLAQELSKYDVVNVGAAGTFVVRKPGSRLAFHAELGRKLPFKTEIISCEGRDLLRLGTDLPFWADPPARDVVRFVSVMSKPNRSGVSFPVVIPSDAEWLVRVIASKGQFACGEYRRHLKTISYLGKLDKLFDGPVTMRSWNTIAAIIRILKRETAKP